MGEFAKDTGAVCSDGNRFKEHVNSKQHKRAVAKEQELMGIPVPEEAAHLLQKDRSKHQAATLWAL